MFDNDNSIFGQQIVLSDLPHRWRIQIGIIRRVEIDNVELATVAGKVFQRRQRIARDEFRHPLRWMEDRSRDTHENALRTMEMLRDQGVGRLIVVTHDLHLPRALRHFERARDAAGLTMEVVPAPVGIIERGPERLFGDYLPSPQGIARSRYALREWLGLLAGA